MQRNFCRGLRGAVWEGSAQIEQAPDHRPDKVAKIRGEENRSYYYSLLENTTATCVPSFCVPTVTITERF